MQRHLPRRTRSYSLPNDAGDLQLVESKQDCLWPCKHHPVAPQYPNGNATHHLNTLSEFVEAVAEGLSRVVFPRSQQEYSTVHVLMISWEDDDLGTAADLQRLKRIFEDTYKFTTDHFKIPSNDIPDFDLEEVLTTTKKRHGRNEDGLIIVCYGGHGEIDKSTQHSIWKAWKFPPRRDSPAVSPQVDWSELQDGFMNSRGDMLFILDCCYAAGALQKSVQGKGSRRNFLLASGNDKASNTNTLTKALLYELEHLAGQPCSVYSLHYRLLANRSIHQWSTVPIHIGEKRIVLAPLPDPAVSASEDLQQLVLADEAILRKRSGCKILVSITLTEIGTRSARDAWVEWIRDNAPPNIAAFDFLDIMAPIAALTTNSEFLLFTLPVSVWNAMTPNPAIKFLTIVYSQNLLYNDSPGLVRGKIRNLADGKFGQLLAKDPLAGDLVSLSRTSRHRGREVTHLHGVVGRLQRELAKYRHETGQEEGPLESNFTPSATKPGKEAATVPARATSGKEYALPQTPRALQEDAMPVHKQTREPEVVKHKMREFLGRSQDGKYARNPASNNSSQLFGNRAAGSADLRDRVFGQNAATKGSEKTFVNSRYPGQDFEHPTVKKNPWDKNQVPTKAQKPELPGKEKDTYPWVSRLIDKIRGPQTKGSASSAPPVPSAQLKSFPNLGVRRKGHARGGKAPQQADPIFEI